MSLTPKFSSSLNAIDVNNYEAAKRSQSNWMWEQLGKINVEGAAEVWLTTLSPRTRINYQSGLRRLAELKLFDPLMTLQAFALVNHESVIDRIKLLSNWTECSRQSRAACYISFTSFLHRRSRGIISRALANREGNAKTFFRVYDKVKTVDMSQAQWCTFLEELEKLSPREGSVAKTFIFE